MNNLKKNLLAYNSVPKIFSPKNSLLNNATIPPGQKFMFDVVMFKKRPQARNIEILNAEQNNIPVAKKDSEQVSPSKDSNGKNKEGSHTSVPPPPGLDGDSSSSSTSPGDLSNPTSAKAFNAPVTLKVPL